MSDWPLASPARQRRRSRLVRWPLGIAAAAVLFGLGVAVGDVLDENADPADSPTRTLVRTLGPLPLSAPPTVTVTVTQAEP